MKYDMYHDDDFAALYEDGKLVKSGDTYLINEYLRAKLGVVDHYNEVFVRNDSTLETMGEVEEYAEEILKIDDDIDDLENELAAKRLLKRELTGRR